MTSCGQPATIILARGSDLRFDFVFSVDGLPVDMSGHTIEIFEADAWTTANATVAWTNQAAGEARLSAEWTPTTPATLSIRIRTRQVLTGFDDALPELRVRFV